MEHPAIEVDNPALFEHYANLPPDRDFMRMYHKVCSKALHYQLIAAPDTLQTIGNHLWRGLPAEVVIGHASLLDPGYAGAPIEDHPELNPLIGTTRTAAAASYFRKPYYRYIFDRGGAVPAFRTKDIKDESLEEARVKARRALAHILTMAVDNGQNIAIFPEGTRNKGDRTKVQRPIGATAIKVIEGIKRPEDLMLICFSPYYGNKKIRNYFRPTLAIDQLKPSEVDNFSLSNIEDFMQSTLNMAIDAYESRSRRGVLGF